MIGETARASLYEWHTPDDMIIMADSLGDNLGRHALLRPGTEYREAFVAARFAKFRRGDLVRLLRPDTCPTPDFAIRLDGSELWFETTEADRQGRKRDLEYAEENYSQSIERIPDEEWVEPNAYLRVIQERCTKKAAKGYERCDGLIIWSNAFPIANLDAMDLAWWQRALRPASIAFSEVWYHARNRFMRAF
jgi:hypothetical protein